MGIGVLQRNRAIGCVCPQEDSEDEELAHTIREAGKLQVLESASGTWRAEGVSSSPKASGLESGEGPHFSLSLKAACVRAPDLAGGVPSH